MPFKINFLKNIFRTNDNLYGFKALLTNFKQSNNNSDIILYFKHNYQN
jgi:hypothetical protein